MLLIRQIHAYLGFLIAPSVLFFAFSGALQIFSLHEAHGGYHPPALIEALGNLHKDQVVSEPDEHHQGPPPGAEPQKPGAEDDGPPPGGHPEEMKVSTMVLKWFFALVAVGLFTSTALGLWIGLRFSRTPRLSWGLLAAGVAIPLLILFV